VNVLLSPSCDRCKIEIQTTSTPQIVTADEPATKKTKREAFQVNDEVAQHLSVDEVIKQIQSSVPPVVTVTIDGSLTVSEGAEGDNLEFEHLYRPIGSVLKSYNREIKYNNDTMEEGNFVITLARGSDQSVALYHNAIQPLARWFIETADDVNVSDEDSGFWSVLYLFRKHDKISRGIPTPHYSLAGYITLFHFNAPFKKPYPGVIVRVCQALILPPYQRSGHGSELLLSVHDYAEKYINNFAVSSNGMDIVEVNVEDPAPGFVALRDITDYQRLLSLITEENDKLDMKYIQMNDVTSWEYFQPAPDEVTLTLSSLLKVTKRQAEIVQEIYKLATVEKWKKNSKDKQLIQQVETNYRLMIKKSLKSFRTEELGACEGGKEGQKALLAKWFAETHSHYLKLLGLV
jgi:histone acetyltransferase 1